MTCIINVTKQRNSKATSSRFPRGDYNAKRDNTKLNVKRGEGAFYVITFSVRKMFV